MIDIHSHILPGLDDGSDSHETSLAMLRLAASAGTTDIVASPHSNNEFSFDPERNKALAAELQTALGPTPHIHSGCDFHLSAQNIQHALEDPTRFSINGLGYLLVEFPDLQIAHNTSAIFAQLQQVGLIPIVTHPERNPILSRDLPRLRRWVENGAFLQVTAMSVTGGFGKNALACSRALLDAGLAHFIASDAHDPKYRTPSLREAFDLIAKDYSPDYAEDLFLNNPGAVIQGHPLFPGPLAPPKRRRRFFGLFG